MQPDVRKITIDFETALWKAFRCLLPNVKLQGCVFHWTQAVWRKVSYDNLIRKAASGELQKVLQSAYQNDEGTYNYTRKLMALPFLPEHEIPPMFENLSQQVQDPALCNLVTYIKDRWIESQIFPPTNWSIYKQAIRTNNDIEGWHNALNRHAGSRANLSFYLLIEILNK